MKSNINYFKPLFFFLGFLLYINTLNSEFTLDDKLYITQNEFVQKGWSGLKDVWSTDLMDGYDGGVYSGLLSGGRYRPLALSIHILEEELHGNSSFWGHFLNALLYGFLGVVSFLFFEKVFASQKERFKWIAVIASAIYILHPLHVEGVANVRNRDELMSSLFGLLSVLNFLSYFKTRQWSKLFLAAIFLLMGLFEKESSLNFIIVSILTLWLVRFDSASSRTLKISFVLVNAMVVAVFFMIRHWATNTPSQLELPQELLNNIYMNASPAEKWAGIIFIYGLSLKMLWLPYPLTHDYYPYYPFRTFDELQSGISPYPSITEIEVLLSIAVLVMLFILMLRSFINRRKGFVNRLVFYTIALFFGTTLMYSNVFFEIGSFFNERFLFVASIAMAAITAYFLSVLISKQKIIGIAVVAGMIVLFFGISWDRASDWENDNVLVLSDVQVSQASARANLIAAEASLSLHRSENKELDKYLSTEFSNYLEQGEVYAKRALFIYPEYLAPLDILGNIYFEQQKWEDSFELFADFYKRKPTEKMKDNIIYLGSRQLEGKSYEKVIKIFKYGAHHFSQTEDRVASLNKLGEIYGKEYNQLDSSVYFFSQSIALDGNQTEAYENLGVVYAISGRVDLARENFLTALSNGNETKSLLINIGLTYNQQGDEAEANKYFERAEAISE